MTKTQFDFLLITTGGTIDSVKYEIADTPVDITPLEFSLVPDTLKEAGIYGFDYKPLEPADSKDFAKGEGFNMLIETIENTSQKHILITQGTDALAVTAVAVRKALLRKNLDKIVVFACSMVPLANGEVADGHGSLRRAVDELYNADNSSGVYISANGGDFFAGNEVLPNIRKEFDAPSPDKRFFYIEN